MNKSIVISNLRKNFKGKIALQDINLSINGGEIFGFLGPSGAGKTTTINILTGQLSPDEGAAKILGEDCTQLTSDKFLELGIMSDNVGFYDRLSLYDNLIFFAKFHNVEISYLDSLLKRLKLYDDRFKKAEKLSTGMKQRMLLIRAILHSPQLIFLDEPTSGMDPTLSQIVHDLLLEIKEAGTTIFLTTHNMEEATKLCDSIALLHKGKIIESGSPHDIIDKYSQTDKVKVTYFDGKEIIVPKGEVSKYLGKNVKTINSLETNLESIFIQLTGEKL
ncbi:Fluoroquinolones export ATP-binding protein [Streptococcus cristatus]|jgi:bacitracin ABC ATP binding cassette transporter, ABC protein|uniref:Fluoroquinolones export ATP-binding protein n=1 Tax=Streptococcus cristatus TaxID=45634 RepID=A0A428GX67_STRCR|nr:ABC transporter ATP-binding protein [Streptococcus cristatus]RSJ80792.1 Fluoroquinolones export ATP-binding protein [Streptococcus cristatus]RSJ82192.1 Fluoroquinolones export ATP-binding protein [Streptococcus cristatus]RSJ87676.1 Fluoroquinolones export ATP-binding protein [Streptococcus cristatus]RSJ88142.1 Fluoroquinolones export ATP-binding protein [Streptococcus cristatus]